MKKTLKFRNNKTTEVFFTDKYEVKPLDYSKGRRYMAIAQTAEGKKTCLFISKQTYEEALAN